MNYRRGYWMAARKKVERAGVGSARLRLHALQTKIQVLVFGTLAEVQDICRKVCMRGVDQHMV